MSDLDKLERIAKARMPDGGTAVVIDQPELVALVRVARAAMKHQRDYPVTCPSRELAAALEPFQPEAT